MNLKSAFDFGKQALSLTKDVQQCKTNIKELRDEFEELVKVVEQLAYQVQRNADNERHEREKLVLRLENALLRHQIGLPPADASPSIEE